MRRIFRRDRLTVITLGAVALLKALVSWSSGKDSAWALHAARAQGVEVVGLLTTVTASFARVAMHAVREQLLEAQAAAVGLPLFTVALPWPAR